MNPHTLDLADYVAQLTATHNEVETYAVRQGLETHARRHVVRVPSLLAQLAANDTPSAAAEDGARSGYESKPAARLEALDAYADIGREAYDWLVFLGKSTRAKLGDVPALVRQVHAAAADVDDKTRRAITRDVRRWWISARIVTGWDTAAWKPDNTCPACGQRGTLRVRLGDQIASCTYRGDAEARVQACTATWDATTIGVLADHIRAESEAEKAPRPGPGPCWCPVPRPVVPDLSRLCPGCGSARCRHALGARLIDTIRASSSRGRVGA